MKKDFVYFSTALMIFVAAISCQKNGGSSASQITVANLTGTYALKGLTWTYLGVTINVYDSIDACERDNLLRLNADMTANAIDAGTVCTPSENADGVWALHGDSLMLGGSIPVGNGKITSFDGTTLVVAGTPAGQAGVVGVTTLKKQ